MVNWAEILKAAELINGSFVWDETPQGHAYWAEVYSNLDSLTKDPKEPKEEPKRTTEDLFVL